MRPFFKWAGAKRQLLPALRRFYPARFQTYHEPFLGSGAVFFDLVARGAVQPRRVRLTDVNSDLIGCWRQLRDDRDGVITHLQTLATERAAAPATHYYQVRDDLFNPARAKILNGSGPRVESYCVFRTMWIADFGGSGSPVSVEVDHRFRRKWIAFGRTGSPSFRDRERSSVA